MYIDNLISPHCCIDRVGDFGVVLCIARLNAGKIENDSPEGGGDWLKAMILLSGEAS